MSTESGDRCYIDLPALAGDRLDELPYSIRVLLEAAARKCDGSSITSEDIENILNWARGKAGQVEIPFAPGRVILQDFTGVPAVVDLAAMRDAIVRMTGDPDAASPSSKQAAVVQTPVSAPAEELAAPAKAPTEDEPADIPVVEAE